MAILKVALLLIAAQTVSCVANLPTPYQISPSQRWDGPDGPWATFDITVGTNHTQRQRALPGLSFSILLLPVAGTSCINDIAKDCAAPIYAQSSSWQTLSRGNFLLALGMSRFLMQDSNTTQAQNAGFDSVGIGYDMAAPIITKQLVAGMVSKELPTSLFGLSNREMNVGGELRPTFLSNLQKEGNLFPSMSFSYTAGSFARNATPPSLILGGYDASRLDPHSTLQVSIEDNTHMSPLVVNLSSISFNGLADDWRDANSKDLSPVSIIIDPALPQIWLPVSACTLFETAFGLQWNDTAQLYLVNITAHDRMKELNASVSFSLQSSRAGDTPKAFTLPYSAFDLNVTAPLVETGSYYFPLKRAASPDQYVLGRPFLQDTLISVDYEARYFNLSQAVFHNHTAPRIETIQPSPPPPPKKQNTLPRRGYIAIGICTASLALLLALLFLCRRNRWWPFPRPHANKPGAGGKVPYDKAELPPDARPWVEIMSVSRVELAAESVREVEVGGESAMVELAAERVVCEMAAEKEKEGR